MSEFTIEDGDEAEDDEVACWCGEESPAYLDEHLDKSCGGSGTLYCHCGGDLCVCHNHGEVECGGCDDCEGADDCNDVDDLDDDVEPSPEDCERHERTCHNCGRGLAHDEPCPPAADYVEPAVVERADWTGGSR